MDKTALQSQSSVSSAAHKRQSTFDDLPASKMMHLAAPGDHVTHLCQLIGSVIVTETLSQGGHKPGILRDFSERGNAGNSQGILCNLRENCNKQSIFSLPFKYLVRVWW